MWSQVVLPYYAYAYFLKISNCGKKEGGYIYNINKLSPGSSHTSMPIISRFLFLGSFSLYSVSLNSLAFSYHNFVICVHACLVAQSCPTL